MKGTIVNVIAVVFGSLVGIFFSWFVTPKIRRILIQGLGLAVILIGVSMAIKTNNVLIVAGSMILGGVLGEVIDIEAVLDRFGEWLKSKFRSGSGTFVTGFVTASLVYCVGAMAVVGSLEEGINGDASILYTKSLLDGVASVAFASTLGIGVIFSIIPVFIYQGALTVMGIYLKNILTDPVIAELTSTGGLLILGIGLNLIFGGIDDAGENEAAVSPQRVKIKVGNLLPALIFAVIISFLAEHFSG
ncbi:MAG: DUF554 domain-containing protein [Deltaproteobacteria bacterium]|uniref:DUF554 domain-containing protein n=1 Tax=Candidatus Zymogenus saltonus TaxID=2844893 RepID=A0A9D8KEV3_9DELT|nr:DUF554 domain-containing protein [Candidatus Zymogenus saltonus]